MPPVDPASCHPAPTDRRCCTASRSWSRTIPAPGRGCSASCRTPPSCCRTSRSRGSARPPRRRPRTRRRSRRPRGAARLGRFALARRFRRRPGGRVRRPDGRSALPGRRYAGDGVGHQAAATPELLTIARRHRAEMIAGGTTCMETKTGYGLTVHDEIRSAITAQAAGFDEISFLGSTCRTAGVRGRRRRVPRSGVRTDARCGRTARAAGSTCSARTAPSTRRRPGGCWPPDDARGWACECTAISSRPAPGCGSRSTSARRPSITAPTWQTAISRRWPVRPRWPRCCPPVICRPDSRPAPGRALVDAGARIALASNCNPGSSYTSSMNLVVALGVLLCKLSTQEAVYAATAGGAAALLRRRRRRHAGRGARGSACPGRAVPRVPGLPGRRAAHPCGVPPGRVGRLPANRWVTVLPSPCRRVVLPSAANRAHRYRIGCLHNDNRRRPLVRGRRRSVRRG